MRVLVTGWEGFIGTNLVRYILKNTDWEVIGVDKHTYAARPFWALQAVQNNHLWKSRFTEERRLVDISNSNDMDELMGLYLPDAVINLAAESHVCNSIRSPEKFVNTNINGTFNLLDAIRTESPKTIFHHVSTDEVYGEVAHPHKFQENSEYAPRSPYSASKAASDHLVMAYHYTYGLNTRLTNCSNNFGPNQHPEKLVPKTIQKIASGDPVVIYGPGTQVRDWIWVDDHSAGIVAAIKDGRPGHKYLLGGEKELTNLEMVQQIFCAYTEICEEDGIAKAPKALVIKHTDDRPTDDERYAIDCTKAKGSLGWKPRSDLFFSRLKETVRWNLKYEQM